MAGKPWDIKNPSIQLGSEQMNIRCSVLDVGRSMLFKKARRLIVWIFAGFLICAGLNEKTFKIQ
jgi:hypothetical protein